MRFSILGFDQEKVLQLKIEQDGKVKKLDTTDLLILREISEFMNRSKIIKYTIDDKVYFSIQYSTILEDLPILDIKKQALCDRLDKMVSLDILEKIVAKNQGGTFVAFRMGAEYENLLYSRTSSEALPTSSELRVQEYSTTTHNTIITKTNKEKEDNKLSSKKKDETSDLVDYIYSIYPTRCPKRNAPTGKSRKDKDRIARLLKTYTKEEIEKVIRAEVDANYGINYMKNFSTFLNNFPDPSCVEVATTLSTERKDTICINGTIYR